MNNRQRISIFIFATVSLTTGCDTGGDLSQPLPPLPIERTFSIVNKTYIIDDSCFVSHYFENGLLAEIQYFLVENDTVYLRGYQEYGSSPVERHLVFTPAHPTLGTEWYGLYGYSALFSVSDSTEVTVPGGTFPAYIYSIADSATSDPLGSILFSEGVGIISMIQITDDDSLSLVLDDYAVFGGDGVFPQAIGNQWDLIEGNWEEAEN